LGRRDQFGARRRDAREAARARYNPPGRRAQRPPNAGEKERYYESALAAGAGFFL
jgi:hypothetical protein